MAARRKDAWLAELETGVTSALLESLFETSAPGLEARLSALTRVPPSPAIAAVAIDFFERFPVKFREQLSCAAVATGLALVHRVKPAQLAKVRSAKAPNDVVPAWHLHVTAALRKVLGSPAKPPTGKGDASALTGRTRAALQVEWLERAEGRHPDSLPPLLARLSDGPATDVVLRAIALLDFARDDRIADAAAAFIQRPTVRVTAEQSLFTVLGLVLVRHGDRSHGAAAEALTSAIPSLSWVERLLPDVAAPQPATKPKASAAPGDEQGFLRFIAEKPSDDGRVAAFTDWLLERGDERGEFMSLQRAGRELTPRELRRVTALAKKHEKAWLGSLARARMKGSAVFRGGLLKEIELSVWQGGALPADDEPALPLLEALVVSGATNLPELRTLLADATRFVSLRRLIAPAWMLENAPPQLLGQLNSVGLFEPPLGQSGPRLTSLARASMPALRELQLRGQWWEQVAEVAALPQFGQLERLVVDTTKPELWLPLTKKVAYVELRHIGLPAQVFTRG